jgi:hypothetical protein
MTVAQMGKNKPTVQSITRIVLIRYPIDPDNKINPRISPNWCAVNLTLEMKRVLMGARFGMSLTLGVVDVVFVISRGRGGRALAALDDLDRVQLLVAPPAHHARAHLQGQVRRPRRGRGRGPRPPLHASSVRRGSRPVARRVAGGGGGAVLRRGRRLHRAHSRRRNRGGSSERVLGRLGFPI